MCWISNKAEKRVAKEDIKTFKVGIKMGDNNFRSYYYNHYYMPLQKYETEICVVYIEGEISITKGFHSYNPKFCRVALDINPWRTRWSVLCEVKGKGGALLDWYIGFINTLFIAECTIPKGAEYYENEFGEIVSNQIIIESIKPIEEQ